jgi:1,2-phenylacetyl-CoA epoxidase PaaB subunit
MATFEVFGRRKWEDALEHVGTIVAPDPAAALLLARETHFRHGEGVDYAVVPREHLYRLADPTLLEHSVDMSYRRQEGYTGFREKRERARQAARGRGLGHLQERPVPGRAGAQPAQAPPDPQARPERPARRRSPGVATGTTP